MAVPAPAIPTGNAYTVNVARPLPGAPSAASSLVAFACAAAPLLARWKVPVRMHVAGDSPDALELRGLLSAAHARASAFSPAPSAHVPGEGFWKTSVIVVEGSEGSEGGEGRAAGQGPGAEPFWVLPREDRKVEWEPLCLALAASASPDAVTDAARAGADLWCVSAPGATPETARERAEAWRARGAGAVVVFTGAGAAWDSGSAAFGRSSGWRAAPAPGEDAESPAEGLATDTALGVFAAGVLAELVHDLLAENLFDKTMVRIERDCLGMRPLRLGRAVDGGLAALAAIAGHGAAFPSKPPAGHFPAHARRILESLRGPASKPWPGKGR